MDTQDARLNAPAYRGERGASSLVELACLSAASAAYWRRMHRSELCPAVWDLSHGERGLNKSRLRLSMPIALRHRYYCRSDNHYHENNNII